VAPAAQLSCVCICRTPWGEDAGELSRPNLRKSWLSTPTSPPSLHITATPGGEVFDGLWDYEARFLPWFDGPLESWPRSTVEELLARVGSRDAVSALVHGPPRVAWPVSASLRVLDLGGMERKVDNALPGELFVGTWRPRMRSRLMQERSDAPGGLLQRIGELRELRILRADLSPKVQELPNSMSQLTNLEELNLVACGLERLFPNIEQCRKLKELTAWTHDRLHLPPSLPQLRRLSHINLQALGGVWAPDMTTFTRLRVLELGSGLLSITDRSSVSGGDSHSLLEASILLMPSLRRLEKNEPDPSDISMLTSLQELQLSRNLHESTWSLGSLRILSLKRMYQYTAAIPDGISRLSSLEELQITQWYNVQCLPDCLAELPHLKKLTLKRNYELLSLPPSMERCPSLGCWPALQALYLHDLRSLQIPEPLLSRLRRGLRDLQISDCPSIPSDAQGAQDAQGT